MNALFRHVSLAALLGHVALAALVIGCGPTEQVRDAQGDDGPVPVRRGTVVVDSCPMDSFQRETLASATTRQVVDEVVLLCLSARDDGAVGPVDVDSAKALRDRASELKALGYRVSFGLSMGEAPLSLYASAKAETLLLDEAWRGKVASATAAWAEAADGVDLALPPLSSASRPGVTELATALSPPMRMAGKSLSVFVPPSLRDPSDIPGGDAYDLASLSPLVDRLRVMTLDYSCCDGTAGPGVDPGWAASAARFAISQSKGAAVDISMPLFGTDFGPQGQRSVTFFEASALASTYGASIARGPTGAPHFSYVDAEGGAHQLWYDDTFSTKLALRAWGEGALDPSVGVLFYGLGAEDPSLFPALARAER